MTEICVYVDENLENVKNVILKNGFIFTEHYDNYDTYFTTLKFMSFRNIIYKQLLDTSLLVRHTHGNDFDDRKIIYKKKNAR